jgi:translation initiation factor IF-2
MSKKRVHEIAKERGMSSKDVLTKLQAAGLDVSAPASTVEEADAARALSGNGAAEARPAAGGQARRAASGQSRTAASGQARPAASGQARPAASGRARPAASGQARPGAAGQARPAAPSQARPAAPGQARPGAAGQARPAAPGQARPAAPGQAGATRRPASPPRRVFEPEGEPLRLKPRTSDRDYIPPPPPPPRPRPRQPEPAPAQRPAAARPSAPAAQPRRPVGPRIIEQPRPAAPAPTPEPGQRPAAAQPPAPAPQARPAAQAAPAAPAVPRAAAPAAPAPTPPRPTAEPTEEPAAPDGDGQVPGRSYNPEAPAPGTGPKIIARPEPEKRPKRDETQSQPARSGRGEGGPGPGRRRVVIDSQASRRTPGGGPGGPQQGPPRRQRRGRRRRGTYDETISPLDLEAQTATDTVRVASGSTVKDVAEYLGVPVPEVIKKLMTMGEMVTLTQTLSDEAIQVIADEFDKKIEIVRATDEEEAEPAFEDAAEDLADRPPVVTIMGHVDHGKTSLLDAIRQTQVVAGEAGGITQHIGAYQVHHNDKLVTFLDTPGHEAFTAMRARGAQVTDIAVIVVAADDGVKPQTDEAIDHAKAAEVPILVAVNKIDKEGADPTRVRTEMTQRGLQPAEWGGETEFVDVSAKTKEGLDDLLDTILVVAELEELKANPTADASGVVIESKLDPGRGPVVTLLISRGTLRVGDAIVAGSTWGRVRAMYDYNGGRLRQAVPGEPVEVLGFDGVPDAGDPFRVVENDRTARHLANERSVRLRNEAQARRAGRKVSFDDIFKGIQEGEVKELNLLLKADVSGSLEAFEDEIARLPQDEVAVDVIRAGVGGINESDVMLAAASDAIILGFNVRPVGDAAAAAEREGVEIRTYSVIYKALDDLRLAMQGMLEPEQVEETVGTAEVRQLFRASRIGTIAGCYVTDGRVVRGGRTRIVRDGTVIYDTTIDTLRRFNDDVREVAAGYECGITLHNYQDVKEGDVLEVYETRAVERALG